MEKREKKDLSKIQEYLKIEQCFTLKKKVLTNPNFSQRKNNHFRRAKSRFPKIFSR